jgi:uncharacterized membrane protein YfhO
MFVGKPADPMVESTLYTKPNETVRILKADPSHFRIFSLSYVSFGGFMHIPNTPFSRTFETLQSFLTPNLSLIFKIDTVDEYAAILMRRYYDIFAPVREFFRLEKKEPQQIEYCKEILSILNVKYLISSFKLEDKDFKLVRDGKVKLYQNLRALPRTYSVPDVTVVKNDAEALKILGNTGFDPRKSALVTGGAYDELANNINKVKGLSPDNYKGDAKILKYSLNNVEIETSGNGPRCLVLADNYYPGWKAFVDGSRKDILKVNYNLRGVIIPPGKHTVQFSFDPLSFRIGAAISLFTVLISIVLFSRKRIVKHL